MDITAKLNQIITYWAPGALNGFGRQASFSAGVNLVGRWTDQIEEIVNSQGETEMSDAMLHFDGSGTVPAFDGRVYLGNVSSLSAPQQADPKLVSEARLVRKIKTTRSLDAAQSIARVWTKRNG